MRCFYSAHTNSIPLLSVMVEVFQTNVEDAAAARLIIDMLCERFPGFSANFDLDDCDRVLRVEGIDIRAEVITELVSASGYQCKVLE